MLRILFLCGLACLIPASSLAQTKKQTEAIKKLEKLISHEVKEKRLPALSIAIVDDQKVIWSKGFGYADPKKKTPATAKTVYRVGSVSKLFTDLAIMQLVEQGKIDLDAPVTKYLPNFKPENPYSKKITLRQLMTHRSGLVRESPVGHYFDPEEPTLQATVESLNTTKLVYEPETKTKYSNAAIATVGYVLEKLEVKPFPKVLSDNVLSPLGMKSTSFEKTPVVKKNLAKAVMWSWHGREFPAPTFELGMTPAGCMYSTVLDLGKFMSALFNEGKGVNGQLVKKETLEKMWTPQFEKKGTKTGFGIGFYVQDHKGKRKIGHGGAIYGFATQLSFMPEEKLGVAVVISRDVANAVSRRLADLSLDIMLALKNDKPIPEIKPTKPVDREVARDLVGRYVAETKERKKIIDVEELDGKVWIVPRRASMRIELRATDDGFVTDDVHNYGIKIEHEDGNLKINEDVYKRVKVEKPKPVPEKWHGLIGEYGWDHNVLYVLEKDNQLYALIEWIFLYPLTEESKNVYAFPDWGLYHGEKLIFKRDSKGRATEVEAASVVFKRRKVDGEGGVTFRIVPRRSIEEIRKEALKAVPPPQVGELLKPDLVDLEKVDKGFRLDIRYATTNNFMSTKLYLKPKAFFQRPAAKALVRVLRKLEKQGYGLLIHDSYRPWFVTKMFWEATPDASRLFVANPVGGSRHNRGCAVDLTLYDLKTKKPIQMVSGYDEFSDRSYPNYPGGTSQQRWHRDLLRRAMESEGFSVYHAEWWHFDYRDWKNYPILNLTFDQIEK